MIRNRFGFLLLALIALAGSAAAQLPQLTGMGMRARLGANMVVEGDSISVLTSFDPVPGWEVLGPAVNVDQPLFVLVHLYTDSSDMANLAGNLLLPVDSATIVLDTLSAPYLMQFRFRLEGATDSRVNSLQLEMGLWLRNSEGQFALSDRRSSHRQVGTTPALGNPVDASHFTFLRVRDVLTLPPDILEPVPGDTVSRVFPLVYNQPEDADTLGAGLIIRYVGSGPAEQERRGVLRDFSAGEGKTIFLNAAALNDTTLFRSFTGPTSLTHHGAYEISFVYQDIHLNAAARDSVEPVVADLRTEHPVLYEPRAGSSTPDSTIRVAFDLPEPADSLWLTFTALTDSLDEASPHILLLNPSVYSSGLHSFYLDGRDIGTSNPLVIQSNRGQFDRLQLRTPYRVTLTYGDRPGNENQSVSTEGYVWPQDQATTPPILIAPVSNRPYGASLWLEFILPETPLPGSVFARFGTAADTVDLGSPHTVYLATRFAGRTRLLLHATALRYSEQVDSVLGRGTDQQNNTLVHGLFYVLRIGYRDSLGNAEAFSAPVNFTFDNRTEPARITAPELGDTLPYIDMPLNFVLPEPAMAGTLQAIFTQVRGPEVDLGSPHTLFLSGVAAGPRSFSLQPAALSTSPGVDSVRGGLSLMARSTYRLTIQYRDTLANEATPVHVDELYYPSGSTVYASGNMVGTGVVNPGELRHVAFRLALRTETGTSALRGLTFEVQGDVEPRDIYAPQVKLWSSVDTLFAEDQDQLIDRLLVWNGGPMVFDSFVVPIEPAELNFIVTLHFPDGATGGHRVHLLLNGPSAIDCGGDPIIADQWPIGSRDVALDVLLTSFVTAQDTAFGALRVQWVVASERDNAGFRLLRRSETEENFQPVAGWNEYPELVGRGTAPVAGRYQYIDRGLQPGRRYYYKLQAESFSGDVSELELVAEGVPRLPPSDFQLGEAYPNPFNQATTITYVVPYTGRVRLVVFDMLGREVRVLGGGLLAASEYRAVWDGRDANGVILPSGIYFVRLQGGTNFFATRKLLLLR